MNVQFGAFEVDLEGRRLLRAGMRIPLREQPFQVLAALLERPGEIVTREELRKRLWPKDTFVDFEVALNSAVSRLRQALSDSVDCPRFIETIPKRGYRLVAPVVRRPGVAVLPFVNQTGEDENEYFSDGLTDELIRELSHLEGLRVAGRSVVFRLKGQPHDARQAGRELGVQAVLEGAVRKAGDRIRVTVNLVDVRDGFNLWAERFDSQLDDLFAIQDHVCERVASALKVSLTGKISERRPTNLEAYNLYLKGHHLTKTTRADAMRRGLECFMEAIRLDPGYAPPYHGAALFYILGALYGTMPPRSAFPEGEKLVLKGLALNEDSAMLQMTLAMLRMFQWRWTEAEEAFVRSISLEPTNSHPHMMYAILCAYLGRHEQALREATRAVELDPLDVMTNFQLLQCLYCSRQFEEAARCGYNAIEVTPGSHFTYLYLACCLLVLGAKDESWRLANAGRKLNGGQPLAEGYFGYVAAVLGHLDEAREVIQELEVRRTATYSPALPISWVYLGLGDTLKALEWLETAFAERDPFLLALNVFPLYDLVRDEPKFRKLAEQIAANV
jgi:TolB-like protein